MGIIGEELMAEEYAMKLIAEQLLGKAHHPSCDTRKRTFKYYTMDVLRILNKFKIANQLNSI